MSETNLPKEVIDKIQHEAEEYAFGKGYPQSDKETFEATYWTLHNVAVLGYKVAALHYSTIIENLKKENEQWKFENTDLFNEVKRQREKIEQLKAENEHWKQADKIHVDSILSQSIEISKLQSQIKGLVEGLEKAKSISEKYNSDDDPDVVFLINCFGNMQNIITKLLTNYYNSIK